MREELRRSTREQHERLESRAFFESLLAGTLDLASYVAWVRALTTIVGALEACVREADEASLRTLDLGARLDLLRADAAVYDDVAMPDSGVVAPTLGLVECLRGWAGDRPTALAGALYVFEGAALGARVQTPHLARFERDGAGLLHPTTLAKESGQRWAAFTSRLDALPFSTTERDAVVATACRTFEGLAAVADALDPARERPGRSALLWLNAEAGRHDVSHDPREVLAAIDAGYVAWSAYPYLEARYGERGRSFTRSDSAWLVTLAEAEESDAERHLRWLTRLLAPRGMPTLLLEEHLIHLHAALSDAVPERATKYVRLARAADRFRARRLGTIPEFAELAASFAGDGGPGNVGPLVVCAVADEHDGIDASESALIDWLQDRDRFSPEWISAVADLRARARAAVARR